MEDRLETADILPVVKERAINNLINTQLDDLLFVVSILGLALGGLHLFGRMFLGDSFKLTRLTLPSFFIIAYIVLMSIPSIIWFYAPVNDPIRYTFFVAVQSVLISFPLGVLNNATWPASGVVPCGTAPFIRRRTTDGEGQEGGIRGLLHQLQWLRRHADQRVRR